MINESREEYTRILFTLKTGNNIMFRIETIGGHIKGLSYEDENNQNHHLNELSSIFETITILKDKLKDSKLTVGIYYHSEEGIEQYIMPVWKKSRFSNPNLPQKVRLKSVGCARTDDNKTPKFTIEANHNQGRISYLLSEEELDFTNNELKGFYGYKDRVNEYYEQCNKILHG